MLLAPPLYRHPPIWYQTGLTQVAARFSSTFAAKNLPPNLHLLPSFNSQDLLQDGVFLNPVSGLHYMLHIFDQAEDALTMAQASSEAQLVHVRDDVRQHDDRMAFLEHRHVHLLGRVDHKMAVDSEFDDWVLNRSEEDWLVVKNLKRLPKMDGRGWQAAAKKQVTELLAMVLTANRIRMDFEVMLVVNPLRHIQTGPTVYNVRMDSSYSCRRLRELFSGFFRKERPLPLPPAFKHVSVRNKITLGTKIRIAILHQLGSIYKASNSGSSYKVLGFEPRPRLITEPPQSANSQPRSYNFIQAATSLRADFSDEDFIKIYSVVGKSFPGELRATFIVLNDDERDRCLELVKASRDQRDQRDRSGGRGGSGGGGGRGGGSGGGGGSGRNRGASVNFMPVQSTSGFVHGPGAGAEIESGLLESLASPPPPPPKATSTKISSAPSQVDPKSGQNRERSKERSRERSKERSRERSRERTPPRSTRGVKGRRSSTDEDEEDEKSRKKSKSSKRSCRRSSTSDSSGSGSGSSSDSSKGSRSRTKSKAKSKSKPKKKSRK